VKITELISVLQQLQENGLDDVDTITRHEEFWYYISGTKYVCGIPHEKNTMGEPNVELTMKRPIKLERAKS
jgi:hypothetical protein